MRAVVTELKKALGDSFADFSTHKSNVFRAPTEEGRTRSGEVADTNGPGQPWKAIRKIRASDELKAYLQQQLRTAPEIVQSDF